MLVNTVSKKTVSLEKVKFPKLGDVPKSFLQELTAIKAKQIRKVIIDLMLQFV